MQVVFFSICRQILADLPGFINPKKCIFKYFGSDLCLCCDLIHRLLSWFGSDQLQQTILIQNLGP